MSVSAGEVGVARQTVNLYRPCIPLKSVASLRYSSGAGGSVTNWF